MGADPTIGTSKEIIYSTAKKLDNPMITNLLNQWYMQNDKEIPILMDETEDSKSSTFIYFFILSFNFLIHFFRYKHKSKESIISRTS